MHTSKFCPISLLTALLVFIVLFGCTSKPQDEARTAQPSDAEDPHSFAKPQHAVAKHLDLDITVDFDNKSIAGCASLTIENKTGTNALHLDTKGLNISRVNLGEEESETTFHLGEAVKSLGQPLVIRIAPNTEIVNVYYTTSPEAAALQWLTPEQTAGGKHPFLFTQSQSILARTWIPCQDSPGVHMTYRAKVRVPAGLMAVMSAENSTQRNAHGVYEFDMPQPIPSYLLALAVGDLEFRPLGERSGVYAEPSVVEKAAWEFADTEKMITAAEALYGPYRWGRYDLIVLPPSFPYGGMENPRLTFATPTILAGDRSLVALVAHELAHSWSGNLVTNATWNDFWLNEGFTTYFEHRIMEAVYGKEYESMLAVLSMQSLLSEIERLGPHNPDTHLYLNLAGRDPDEAANDVAYDKGHYFLRLLEQTFGREKWDAFLRDYFDLFAFQSMTTAGFLEHLRNQLIKGDEALEKQLQIDAWIYGAGIPANCPQVKSDAFEQVENEVRSFQKGKPAASLATAGWTTHHWLHFMNELPDELATAQMNELDAAFRFSSTGNAEIKHTWLLHAIASEYEPAYPALEEFLISQGRRKFLDPLYAELAKTPSGLQMARRIYAKARPRYHPASQSAIDKILG